MGRKGRNRRGRADPQQDVAPILGANAAERAGKPEKTEDELPFGVTDVLKGDKSEEQTVPVPDGTSIKADADHDPSRTIDPTTESGIEKQLIAAEQRSPIELGNGAAQEDTKPPAVETNYKNEAQPESFSEAQSRSDSKKATKEDGPDKANEPPEIKPADHGRATGHSPAQSSFKDHPIFSGMRALRYVRFNHSAVFFLFAAFGVASLVGIKSIQTDINIILYFVVVFGIMGTYFFLNMLNLAGLRLRYDQLGDNLYYLGFIYTLGTLTHTLYKFDGTTSTIHEVISSFGIALSSTVLGVVLRIVAHLMRLDPHEVEDAVRSDLIDLTSRVRASLDTVVRDLTIFGDQTRQAVTELHSEVSRDITGNVDRLVETSGRILNSVEETFQIFTQNTQKINSLAESTVNVLTALVTKIQSIEAPSNLIEKKLLPATNQIERIVHAMAETSLHEEERVHRLKSVTESMNAAIASVREHLSVISSAASQEEIASRVKAAAEALREMSASVSVMRDQMKSLVQSETESVVELRKEFETSLNIIREQNMLMRDELQKSHVLTAETQDALVQLAKALRAAV